MGVNYFFVKEVHLNSIAKWRKKDMGISCLLLPSLLLIATTIKCLPGEWFRLTLSWSRKALPQCSHQWWASQSLAIVSPCLALILLGRESWLDGSLLTWSIVTKQTLSYQMERVFTNPLLSPPPALFLQFFILLFNKWGKLICLLLE